MMEYMRSAEAQDMADALIKDHHHRLADTKLQVCFAGEVTKKGGHEQPGGVSVISGKHAFLAGNYSGWATGTPFFFVHVAYPVWAVMSDWQRRGLLDHLLSQCRIDPESGALKVQPPEFGEFQEVTDRNGLWRPHSEELKLLAKSVGEQVALLPEDEREGDREAQPSLIGAGGEG